MKKQKKSLSYWLWEVGDKFVAKELNVNPSTVRHWRLGYGLPRAHQMRAIKKLTKGVVGYEQMIEGDIYEVQRYS